MKSDPQFYKIFHDNPELLPDILPIKPDQGYTYEALSVKDVQRHLDGIVQSPLPGLPIWVVEFQVQGVLTITPRLVLEVSAVQLENLEEPIREVYGLLIYPARSCEKVLPHWDALFTSGGPFAKIYLDEHLATLPEDHPLVCTFAPFFAESLEEIFQNAYSWYDQIHNNTTLTDKGRASLEKVFTSWLLQVFKDKSPEEVFAMLTSLEPIPLEESSFYKGITIPLRQKLKESEEALRANKEALREREKAIRDREEALALKAKVGKAIVEHGSIPAAAQALSMTEDEVKHILTEP